MHRHDASTEVLTQAVLRYAVDLRSLTGGRGRFTMAHDHYDVLPGHLVDQVRRDVHEAE